MERLFKDGLLKIVRAYHPSADRNDAAPVSRRVRVDAHEEVYLILETASAAGNATLTVNAFAANSGGSGTAVPFYKQILDDASSPADAIGAEAAVAAAGFATTLSKNAIYVIRFDPADMVDGLPFLEATLTEVTNSPVVGAGQWLLAKPKFAPSSSSV